MAIIAGASSTSSVSSSALTFQFTPTGLGAGTVFVAVSLILLLGYYDILNSSDRDYGLLTPIILPALGPLFLTFVGILTFMTISTLGTVQ